MQHEPAIPWVTGGKKVGTKYLIVSTGRCGSSLLSGILSECGADFGPVGKRNWDRSSGSYEHPLLDRAYKWHRASKDFRIELWPLTKVSTWCSRRRDRCLSRVFGGGDYAKSTQLVDLVHPISDLCDSIRVIVCYRSFNGYAMSRYRRFGWDTERLAEEYERINRTALLQLRLFGGCAISYEELMQPKESDWADALDELAGLSRSDLLEARGDMVEPRRHEEFDAPLNQQAEKLYERLKDHKGQIHAPAT